MKYTTDVVFMREGEEYADPFHYDVGDEISPGDRVEIPEYNEETESEDYMVCTVWRLPSRPEQNGALVVDLSFSHWASEE